MSYNWKIHLVLAPDDASKATQSPHGGYCKGVDQLLRGIEKYGSLFAAAKSIKMSYSWAWMILRTVQDDLGVSLVETHGPHGSVVTEEGKRLMCLYEEAITGVRLAESKWAEDLLS